MNVVWFSWKDMAHPDAGGAEVVSTELRERLVRDGHSVTLITSRPTGAAATETINGVRVLRSGGRLSVYLHAKKTAKKHIKKPTHLLIDEMNTVPFLAASYLKSEQRVLLTYQLARSVWFYQMLFPLSLVGYLLEPLYLRFVARMYPNVVTESESTKIDLLKHGFKKNSIAVFSIGMEMKPLSSLPSKQGNDILFFGALRPMKRPLDAIAAFEAARDKNQDLHLHLAGNDYGRYAQKVRRYVSNSRWKSAITMHGKVSAAEKLSLMQQARLQLVTSTKEGWGLIATEANSQGTPVVGYDVDGVRDSIQNGTTGTLVENGNVTAMSKQIIELCKNAKKYADLRTAAWESSKHYTFANSYKEFLAAITTRQ